MTDRCKHPLDVINERLTNGYYREMPPFSYCRDAAFVNYMFGYCSKVDYEIAKAKYEMYNYEITLTKRLNYDYN